MAKLLGIDMAAGGIAAGMSGSGKTDLGKYLRQVPEFEKWRSGLISDARDQVDQVARRLDWLLIHSDSELFLSICEKTRIFWSGVHSSGLGRRVPLELRYETEEFCRVIGELLLHKDDLLSEWGEEAPESKANQYFDSMERRQTFARMLLDDELEHLGQKMEEYAAIDAENIVEIGTALSVDYMYSDGHVSGGPECKDSTARVLLCGICSLVGLKLVSWKTELEAEAGPFALSVKDHWNLGDRLKDSVESLLEAANRAAQGEKTEDQDNAAIEAVEDLLNDYLEKIQGRLTQWWREVQSATDAESGLEEIETKAETWICEELNKEVGRLAESASALFKAQRNEITNAAWNEWLTFRLSPGGHAQDLKPLKKQADSLLDGTLPLSISASEKAEMLNDMIEEMLVFDVPTALSFAKRFVENPVSNPAGFYELQLTGLLADRLLFHRPEADATRAVLELIETCKNADTAQFDSQVKKNGILSELLAIYSVVSGDGSDEIEDFQSLFHELKKSAGDSVETQLFLQGFIDRSVPHLQKRQFKLLAIDAVIQEPDVRWPDEELFSSLRKAKKLALGIEDMAVSA